MRRKKYYLHKRNGIFYAELTDPISGQKLTAKSTSESNRDDALLVVSDWLRNGIPLRNSGIRQSATETFTIKKILSLIKTTELSQSDAERIVKLLEDRNFIAGTIVKTNGYGNELFSDFIIRLWDWNSIFIREKVAYRNKISKRHCNDMVSVFNRYWFDKFQNFKVGEIKREDIKNHLIGLKDNGFATSTLNQCLNVIAAPMAWAFREGLISFNPATGIKRFSGPGRKRDILTQNEIKSLIALEWPDKRGKLAFVVSLTCGLRLGEVVALQLRDVGEDRLYIRHSWSRVEGLKLPKSGEERETPLLSELRDELRKLGSNNFWTADDDRFIFFSNIKNQPLDSHVLSDQFINALNLIGIDDKTRRARNLVFHSLRHNFTKAISTQVDQQTAMRATGHKTAAIFNLYSDHQSNQDFDNLITVNKEIWRDIFVNTIDNNQVQ